MSRPARSRRPRPSASAVSVALVRDPHARRANSLGPLGLPSAADARGAWPPPTVPRLPSGAELPRDQSALHIRQPARSNTAPAFEQSSSEDSVSAYGTDSDAGAISPVGCSEASHARLDARPCPPEAHSEFNHGMVRAAQPTHKPAKSEASPAPGSSFYANARAATSASALAGEFAHSAVPPLPQSQSYAPPQCRLLVQSPIEERPPPRSQSPTPRRAVLPGPARAV
jgi:hypothetical protein